MVASPVENHSIVLLKLDRDIQMSDFARPVCIAEDSGDIGDTCVGLGWDDVSGELRVSQLDTAAITECQADSEVAANSLCMTAGDSDDSCPGN